MAISIILPAKNEALGLSETLPLIKTQIPNAEIIVVNDASTDNTAEICQQHQVTLITHHYSRGNGAAIKTGARAAKGDTLIFMDADGQHSPTDLQRLLKKLNEGYDMVVGSRNSHTHADKRRRFGNKLYNRIASRVTGHKIDDLTSGFRAVKADLFKSFLHLLPNGFSYPTTITMAFFRSGYSVAYVPINAERRIGKSHIKLTKDGIRFLLIIFRIGTLYSPLKIFLPISAFFFISGIGYYLYTYLTQGRFTNMGVLLLITSIFIFLMGLISEQISNLLYTNIQQ
jgi:glycosyltransferase involved in cell wall biosynthesis